MIQTFRTAPRAALVLALSLAAAPALAAGLPVRVIQPDASRLSFDLVSAGRTDAGVRLAGDLLRPLGIRGSSPGRVVMEVHVAGAVQPLCAYASRGGFNRIGMPRARFHGFLPLAGDVEVTKVNISLARGSGADVCGSNG